jgi:hypothetical protein
MVMYRIFRRPINPGWMQRYCIKEYALRLSCWRDVNISLGRNAHYRVQQAVWQVLFKPDQTIFVVITINCRFLGLPSSLALGI